MVRACPKCRRESLENAKGALASLTPQEHALFCSNCHGYWMPHAIVELWQSDPFVELSEDEPLSIRVETDRRTGLCPMGHGILVRAKVDLDKVFYLERCGLCRGVWLDRGEWQRLAAALYLDHLDDLWDPTWQKQRRTEALENKLDRALADCLGTALFEELKAVVLKLREHPNKAQALAWVVSHLDAEHHRESSTQHRLPASR